MWNEVVILVLGHEGIVSCPGDGSGGAVNVIDYVVHELAHLAEPHHTSEFWRRVSRAPRTGSSRAEHRPVMDGGSSADTAAPRSVAGGSGLTPASERSRPLRPPALPRRR